MFTKLLRFPVFASTAAAVIITQGILAAQTPGLHQTATWNAGAETFIAHTLDVTDTASAAGSLLARYRVGAATMFSVSKAGALALAGTASFTGGTFTTALSSVTAQATLGAMAATQGSFYASTVSGATLQGYGTTADVTLKNRAGTDVLKIGPNTTAAVFAGAVTGVAASFTTGAFSSTLGVTGNLTVGASTFVVTAATGALSALGEVTAGNNTTVQALSYTYLKVRSYDAGGSAAIIQLGKSLNASLGGMTATGDGNALGRIDFEGVNTATAFATAAYISVSQNGAAGASSIGGVLTINVTASGGASTVNVLSMNSTLATFATSLAVTGALTGVTNASASGYLAMGGVITTSVGAGEIALAQDKALRGAIGTSDTYPLIQITANGLVLIGSSASGIYMAPASVAGLRAASAANDGAWYFDTSGNQLVIHDGTTRYYFTPTGTV